MVLGDHCNRVFEPLTEAMTYLEVDIHCSKAFCLLTLRDLWSCTITKVYKEIDLLTNFTS